MSRRLPVTAQVFLRLLLVAVLVSVAYAFGHGTVGIWRGLGIAAAALLLYGAARHAISEIRRAVAVVDKGAER